MGIEICKRPAMLALVAALLLIGGCNRTPQLNGDEDCLGAADALWTAVTAKSIDLVNNSAREIEKLHASSKMPEEAFAALSGIISLAREGRWDDARGSLKQFVRGQRPAERR